MRRCDVGERSGLILDSVESGMGQVGWEEDGSAILKGGWFVRKRLFFIYVGAVSN